MLQRYGDESYCWSSLGKQYTQEISLVYPVLITTQPLGTSPNSENNNNSGGLFGIGEVNIQNIELVDEGNCN
jgi:hypothetical protein